MYIRRPDCGTLPYRPARGTTLRNLLSAGKQAKHRTGKPLPFFRGADPHCRLSHFVLHEAGIAEHGEDDVVVQRGDIATGQLGVISGEALARGKAGGVEIARLRYFTGAPFVAKI